MPNISIQIIPSLKDLLNKKKPLEEPIFKQDTQHLYLSRSCFAIELICRNVSRKLNRPICIWIPQYFCGESLNPLREKKEYKLFFYPITNKLLPDFDGMKQIHELGKPDVFLFVHYFGNYLEISGTRQFCDEQGSILIEDCAHILYEDNCFGKSGDYSVFSPHKCFPITDGSVLCINNTDSVTIDDIAYLNNIVSSFPKKDSRKQYVKNIVKKVLGVKVQQTYTCQEHYDKYLEPEMASRISPLSMRILMCETREKALQYKKIRCGNLQTIKQLVLDAHLPVRILNNENEKDIPYMCVMEILDDNRTYEIKDFLSMMKLPMGVWTYIPFELKNKDAVEAKRLSKLCFTIPLHQKINDKDYGITKNAYRREKK